LHVVYSYHHNDRQGGPSKTIKYVRFNETWVEQGDSPKPQTPDTRPKTQD